MERPGGGAASERGAEGRSRCTGPQEYLRDTAPMPQLIASGRGIVRIRSCHSLTGHRDHGATHGTPQGPWHFDFRSRPLQLRCGPRGVADAT